MVVSRSTRFYLGSSAKSAPRIYKAAGKVPNESLLYTCPNSPHCVPSRRRLRGVVSPHATFRSSDAFTGLDEFPPCIAAYFAAKYRFDVNADFALTDAAVWALEPHRLNESQDYEPVFPPINAESLQDMVRPAIKGPDISKVAVLAASPLEIDLRMFVQQGQFTIHVTDEPLNQMQGSNNWLKKIRIPATAIGEIAKQLDLLGVRLADVFPDLQNLATEITNTQRSS